MGHREAQAFNIVQSYNYNWRLPEHQISQDEALQLLDELGPFNCGICGRRLSSEQVLLNNSIRYEGGWGFVEYYCWGYANGYR